MKFVNSVVLLLAFGFLNVVQSAPKEGKRCTTPPLAPKRIEKVIGQCQNEVKLAILNEALSVLAGEVSGEEPHSRSKRQVQFSDDEQRIAGCLLQCVYQKVKAVDQNGFPTVDGLVRLYTEGVNEEGYYLATLESVQTCLGSAHNKHAYPFSQDKGKSCDIAFDTFDCISDRIGEYCGQRL